jgi:cysteine-rich repeat protein
MNAREISGFKRSAGLFMLGLAAASCTSILGIDEDYHKPDGGTGGSGGSSTTASTSGSAATTSSSGMGSCGDGILQGPEECDDKNETANDGCTGCVVDCDMSMGEFKEPLTLHCYRLVTLPMLAWQDAEADCVKWGGHLASITSEAENTAVTAIAPGDVWVGATDEKQEWTFVWSNGEPMEFKAWAAGSPSNSGGVENCVELGSDNLWNDDRCDKNQPYLCERTPAGGN